VPIETSKLEEKSVHTRILSTKDGAHIGSDALRLLACRANTGHAHSWAEADTASKQAMAMMRFTG